MSIAVRFLLCPPLLVGLVMQVRAIRALVLREMHECHGRDNIGYV